MLNTFFFVFKKYSKTILDKCIESLTKKSCKANSIQDASNIFKKLVNSLRHFISSHFQNKWPEIFVEILLADKVCATYCCDPVHFFCAAANDVVHGRLCGRKHSVAIMVIVKIFVNHYLL